MLQKTILFKIKRYPIKAIFWLIAVLLGALQAWANCYNLATNDAIAYLDIGDAYLRGEWNVAIAGYWSPLYSWLLGLTMAVLKPSTYWEFPVVKLVNFLMYLFALACFDFFLNELIFYYQNKTSRDSFKLRIPEWVWIVSGYTLFIWSSLKWTGIYSDTPDMCTAALIYLASGIVLRIHTWSESWFNFIMLGAILGFAYLSKAAMLPISFAFLGVSLFSVGKLRLAFPRVIAAFLVFAIVSTPFIAALSISKGRLTYSDTGKLAYAWLVSDHVKGYKFWQGKEPDGGIPKHPPRKIFDNPEAFEFVTPVGGTYPIWHDPSYWYEGLKSKFILTRQIRILGRNIIFYYKIFLGSLIFGYLILVCARGKFWFSVKELTENWLLLIPAVAGLSAYAIGTDVKSAFIETQPSTRYIAPFIVLLFAGVFSSVRLPNSQESKRLIAGITIAVLVAVSVQLSFQASKDLWNVLRPQQHIQWQIANRLNQLGVHPGERVAIFGYNHPFWARLARVKIVAEISDEKSFWEKDADIRSEVIKTIERTGARAIIQRPSLQIPDRISANGWQEIGDTGYYVYFLEKKV